MKIQVFYEKKFTGGILAGITVSNMVEYPLSSAGYVLSTFFNGREGTDVITNIPWEMSHVEFETAHTRINSIL